MDVRDGSLIEQVTEALFGRARIALRDPQEPAQGGPELGYARDFLR